MTYVSVQSSICPKNAATKPTSNSRVYFLAAIVVLPTILSGMETCFSSIALPQMQLSVGEASWYAAGPGLTAALGALVMGPILDWSGRKATLILCVLCYVIGWTIIAINDQFLISFIGRLFTGIPATFVGYTSQVYIVECLTVNDEYLRDSLRTWPTIGFAVGQLFTFLLGALMTHLQFAIIAAVLSTVLIILMCIFVVESPGWLYQKGRIGDAEEASRRLRITQPILETTESLPSRDSSVSLLDRCRQGNVYKPAIIMMVVCTLAICTGGMALSSYMVNIIDAVQPGSVNGTAVTSASSDAFKYSIISGALMVLACVLLSFALPFFGARKLTIGSAICMSVCMALIGFSNDRPNPADLLALRVFGVWAISFIHSLGIITVPFSVLGAMFPLDAKAFGSLAIVVQVLSGFAVSTAYPYMYLWSHSGVFYVYCAMCLVYALFVYFFMPETVGRNYEQISADF